MVCHRAVWSWGSVVMVVGQEGHVSGVTPVTCPCRHHWGWQQQRHIEEGQLSGFVPIFVWPSPPSSGWTTHIVRLDHPHRLAGPPTSPGLSGLCLTLFLDSRMFSFHNRMFLHMLSSSTFYLRLDPQSLILISVTYPHLSDSGSH